MVAVRHTPARSRLRRIGALLLIPLTTGALLTACSGEEDAATQSLESFLASWRNGSVPGHQAEYQQVTAGLGAGTPELSAGEVTVDDDRASVPVTVAWTLGPEVRWEYETTVRLARSGEQWQVEWSPSTVQPDLAAGRQLVLHRGPDTRGAIVDARGKPITESRPVVVVGVQPRRVTSAEKLATALGSALEADGVDTKELPKRISEADPDAFLPVVTLRKERYLEVRAEIYELPGTVFREEMRVLAPTRDFARALLGTVDAVTREDIEADPGRFQVGDQKGHNGLQELYDQRLRGVPSTTVTIGTIGDAGTDPGRELFRSEQQPGRAVRTTLDPGVQNAADAAVAEATKNSAIVAIRISDGSVLAVTNSPGAGMRNIAMDAQVPPGSTFKIVSGLTLLDSGAVDLDAPVSCPVTTAVGGREFKNAWDGGIKNATFRDAFAESCNTAFALLAPKLGQDGLAKTAATLGIGKKWDIGVPVYTGSVATDGKPVDRAAAAFGQGRTIVSPMAMASATAAVARGQWRQPALVTEPVPAAPAPDGPELDPASIEKLHTVMREVVTDGTGSALNSVGGDPVFGKTGTAEYGTETPPRSHSWFAGWQGDIAFAVFVEDGGNEAGQALSTTKSFLADL